MPDYYEQHLLGLAVEAVPEGFTWWQETGGTYRVHPESRYRGKMTLSHPALEAALRALLDDLGVSYPKRPSAERVAEELAEVTSSRSDNIAAHREDVVRLLRDLHAREPLTVAALLAEGGGE